MMTNILVESCLDQEIIKISNLIQVKERMSETETYPKAEVIPKPNLFEYRMFRNSEVWIEHTT